MSLCISDQQQRAAYDVMPDGRFVMVERRERAPLTHLRVVINWVAAVKKSVAAE